MHLSQCPTLQAVINEIIFESGTVSNLEHIFSKCEDHGLLSGLARIAYEAGVEKEVLIASIAVRTWITLLQLSSQQASNELELLLSSFLYLSNADYIVRGQELKSLDASLDCNSSSDRILGTKYYHRVVPSLVCSLDKKALLLVGNPECLGQPFFSSVKGRSTVGDGSYLESCVELSSLLLGPVNCLTTVEDIVSSMIGEVGEGKDVFWHDIDRSLETAGISSLGLVGEMSRSGMSVIGMTARLSLSDFTNARPHSQSVVPLLIHPIHLSQIHEAARSHADVIGARHGVFVPTQLIETIIHKIQASIPESDLLDKVLSVIDELIVHERRNESDHTPVNVINIIIEKTLTTQTPSGDLFGLLESLGWYGIRQDDAKVLSQYLMNAIAGVGLFPLRPNLCLGLYGWSERELREFIDILCLANGTATGDVIDIDVVGEQGESYGSSCHVHGGLGLSCALDIENFRPRSVIVIHGADQCSVDVKETITDIVTTGIVVNKNLEPVTFSESIVILVAQNPIHFEVALPAVSVPFRSDANDISYGTTMKTNSPMLDFEFVRRDSQSVNKLINAVARIIGEDRLLGLTFEFTERAGVYFSSLSARQASEIFRTEILPAIAPSEERERKPVIVDIDNGHITIVKKSAS